jgi:hypothetical protein
MRGSWATTAIYICPDCIDLAYDIIRGRVDDAGRRITRRLMANRTGRTHGVALLIMTLEVSMLRVRASFHISTG